MGGISSGALLMILGQVQTVDEVQGDVHIVVCLPLCHMSYGRPSRSNSLTLS